jgi:secreted trypsin-like serine protease
MIVGGRTVPETARGPVRRATVALTTGSRLVAGGSFCTAVVVASEVLLTAAHCVIGEGSASPFVDGEPIVASFDTKVGEGASGTREVVAVAVHEGYRAGSIGAAGDGPYDDLALVRLASAVPETASTVELPVTTTSLAEGDELTLAGYGVTRTRAADNTGRLRQVKARVRLVDRRHRMLIVRGTPLGGARVGMFRGSCAGDSGGPAFRDKRVVGILSYGYEAALAPGRAAVCVGDNGYTDLRRYADALRIATEALGGRAGRERQAWRFDSAGRLR